MTPNPDRVRLELLAARYLEAVEHDDFETQEQLWKLTEGEPRLVEVFHQVHEDLLAEQNETESARATNAITSAVEQHLTSAEIVTPTVGPVTVADVANELFHHTPDRLPAEAHVLNDWLRQSAEELPASLGLSKFVAWAEAKFGPGPAAYWDAFYEALIKLDLRRSAGVEFQLAARRAPKPEDRK